MTARAWVSAGAVLGAVLVAWCAAEVAASQQAGLAIRYPCDEGLAQDPAVLYFLDFDDGMATRAWYGTKQGYGWTNEPENVLAGEGALEIQQIEGTHVPSEIHPWITKTDVAFVRWYRKWEDGYDWTQHKMSGVYAWADGLPGGGGAGIPPNGYDKYSCKLYVNWNRVPCFYTYHPDQAGNYGDGLGPNLADPGELALETGRWYCFEMMIKANNHPDRDGELKMWVDGRLVGHYHSMRFRDTNELKINQFTYSAYVGGSWVSQQDQKLWDDQIVVATEYIGPLADPDDPYWPTLGHEVKYLGDGVYGVTFTIHANDGQPSLFFADIAFEGTGGGQIQQAAAFGVVDVHSDADAAVLDGVPEANYDKDLDSYFLEPFPSNIMGGGIVQGDNHYAIAASAPALYEDVALAYLVTTGDVSYNGLIRRVDCDYATFGTAVMPLPGDADRNGHVDGLDYNTWSACYQQTGVGWCGGDFNGDGVTDGLDYNIWSLFYEVEQAGPAVPEPAAAFLLALAGAALLSRRRGWSIPRTAAGPGKRRAQ